MTRNEEDTLEVDFNSIERKSVKGLTADFNTVRFHNLSENNFLKKNYTNIKASCLNVDSRKEDLFYLRATLQFWTFIFDQNANRNV